MAFVFLIVTYIVFTFFNFVKVFDSRLLRSDSLIGVFKVSIQESVITLGKVCPIEECVPSIGLGTENGDQESIGRKVDTTIHQNCQRKA